MKKQISLISVVAAIASSAIFTTFAEKTEGKLPIGESVALESLSIGESSSDIIKLEEIFPDPLLRRCVANELKKETGKDSRYLSHDLELITFIGVGAMNQDNVEQIGNLEGIQRLVNLECIDIVTRICNNSVVSSYKPILCYPSIPNYVLTDLTPLASLKKLSCLSLNFFKGITDLSPISNLKVLHCLTITGCDGITDMQSLTKLQNLEHVYMYGCHNVKNIDVLRAMPNVSVHY